MFLCFYVSWCPLFNRIAKGELFRFRSLRKFVRLLNDHVQYQELNSEKYRRVTSVNGNPESSFPTDGTFARERPSEVRHVLGEDVEPKHDPVRQKGEARSDPERVF